MRLIAGAVEQTRTAEPHPYQGCALPPELQQRIALRIYNNGARVSRISVVSEINQKPAADPARPLTRAFILYC